MPDSRTADIGACYTRRTLLGALASMAVLQALPIGGGFARPATRLPGDPALDEAFVLVDGWVLPARYFRA